MKLDDIIFNFDDIDDTDDIYKTVNSTKQLAQLDDEIDEIINFPKYNEYDEAIAVINGKYPGIGFDHQDAMINAVESYKIKPESVIRGFIDMNNKVAFIFPGIMDRGAYLEYIQQYAKENNCTIVDNDIIDNIKNIAKIIKNKLNINKVYALHHPKANQVKRLAKLI